MANFYGFYPPSGGGGVSPVVQQITGIGTAGVPDTGVVTVQGIAGMTPLDVAITGQPISVTMAGRSTAWLERLDYTGTPVTTGAYVQLIAATISAINWVTIFDSSGSAMILAIGAPGSEVDQLYVPPGGSTAGFELRIPLGSRVSYKALDANATSGQLIITGLN